MAPQTPAGVASAQDMALVARLRGGDEEAFRDLVRRMQPAMIRLARSFVPTQAVAEDVAQEAWLGVLNGLDRFEGRAALRTWILKIVTKRAITRGTQERRSVPFSSLVADEITRDDPAVTADQFVPADGAWAGHWAVAPRPFDLPSERLLARETREQIHAAIEGLPRAQRAVISLRDVEGWDANEVCATLDISEANQRVLLHRARSKVRAALDTYLTGDHS